MKRMLKKSLALILVLTMVFGSAPLAGFVGIELPKISIFGTKAEAATYGVLSYEINDGEVTITDCDESASGELEIPGTIEGYPVTSIGDYAFYDCTSLEDVIIGKGVTSVEYGAFYGCSAIKTTYYCGTMSEWLNITIDSENECLTNNIVYEYGTDNANYGSSSCGSDLSWILYANGELDISGLGAMTDWSSTTNAPWYEYRSLIKSVTIGNGVTSIGNYAFEDCTSLASVTISDSVISIGSFAFSGCSSLDDVYYIGNIESWCNISFGNSYATPNYYAKNFYIDSELVTDIVIPDTVSKIKSYAFYGCTSLTSITIPDSVTSIGERAFEDCTSLTNVYYTGNIESWCNISFSSSNANPNYYAKNFYIDGELVTDIVIPDTVSEIKPYAFSGCTNLTSITIPDSITSIGNYAFYNCSGIKTTYYCGTMSEWKNITIGSDNGYLTKTIIYEYGTDNANYGSGSCGENLTWKLDLDGNLIISGSGAMTDWSSTTNAPWYEYRSLIKSVTIGNGVTSIGNSAFEDCTSLTSVTIPDSVTSIGYRAFYGCTSLKELTMPISAKIYMDTFEYCKNIEKITLTKGDGTAQNYGTDSSSSATTTYYQYTPWYISNCGTIILEDGVTSIGDYAFYECTSLTSVTIGNGVTSIGNFAFYYCSSLASITIPDSVTSIGSGAFNYCTSLNDVYYTGNIESWCNISFSSSYANPNCYAKNFYINGDIVTDIVITDTVSEIKDYAFSGCTSLTSITIPDSVTSIGVSAFYGCSGIKITYYSGTMSEWKNITIGSDNGYLTKTIIYEYGTDNANYGSGTCGENLTWKLDLDGNLIISGSGAMTDWSSTTNAPWYEYRSLIKSVTIGYGVTSIGDYAFYNCSNLSSTTIPNSVTYIGKNAFYNTASYNNSDNWENGVLYIDNALIFADSSVISGGVVIRSGTVIIPDYAFYDCYSLTSITIPDSVTSIGYGAFNGCTSLTSITIPDSVTNIGDYAFSYCKNLEKLEILGYSVAIADNAFSNSSNIILYCKSGSSVQSYAELNNLMYVLIDGSAADFAVKNNQIVAYKGSSENPKIPSGVTSIGANAFKNNSTVKTLELPGSVTSIFSGAFANCSALEEIFIPYTVTTIAADAFNGSTPKIICYENSTAHQFAIDNGLEYELVKVTLNETTLVLKVGDYSIITATPEQEFISSVEMSWKSSDTSIATVDENGKVTAKSNGNVTISAIAPNGETLATCSVSVISKEYKVTWVVDGSTTIQIYEVGKTIVAPANPTKSGYRFVGWTPSVPSIMPDYDLTFTAVFEPSSPIKADIINQPTQTTIDYGDSIILHVDETTVPAGARIEWTADNGNFSMSASSDGSTCKISPKSNGKTVFTVTVYDKDGNVIGSDTQEMTAKAGIWQKIIAIIRKIFGLTKTIPEAFKNIV